MANMTPKEKCFKDALDAYNDAFPDKNPNVKLFQDWYRDTDGKWYQASTLKSFGNWIGSIMKTMRIGAGLQDPRAPGAPNPVQWRTPDITDSSGKVYDLKFTDKNGNIDPWGDKPGMNGGGNQAQDQAAINKQKDPNGKEISLDKNSCKCEARGKPQPVEKVVPNPMFFMVPLPSPGGVVVPGAVPGVAPAPAPGGFGLPEFVFP